MTDPGEIVRMALDRLNDHDLDGYYALCSDDLIEVGLATIRGKASVRANDDPLYLLLSDHWRRVKELLVSGDTVAVWLAFGGTHSKSGAHFEIDVCDIVEVRDRLIQSLTMYADWAPMVEALQS